MSQKITIVVDGMGGDYAPTEIVKGIFLGLQENPDLNLILVGEPELLRRELKKSSVSSRVKIKPASQTIEMKEKAPWAVRAKTSSSIMVGLRLIKEGEAEAFVSAGNTGAVVSAAQFILGRIKGINRPAIAVVIPTPNGPVVMLDAGANVQCKPKNLLQFAKMGRAYAKKVLGIKNPSIGLLNIGKEKGKGSSLTKMAYLLLENSALNFRGNVEGESLPLGKTKVVVCDGFTGNVTLKAMEGTTEMIFSEVKSAMRESFPSRIGSFFLSPSLNKVKRKVDYEEYGGAQLLGVNGVVIIAHGSSTAKAIKNAIEVASQTALKGVLSEIERSL